MFSYFWNCLTLLDASGFDESGYNRRGIKWGINSMSTRWRQHAQVWRWVPCVVKRNRGRKEILKHLTETNSAIQYGLFDALTTKLLEIQPTYKATLKCDRLATLTVPLPWPSPQSQQSTSRFTSLWIVLICFAHSEHRVFTFLFVH